MKFHIGIRYSMQRIEIDNILHISSRLTTHYEELVKREFNIECKMTCHTVEIHSNESEYHFYVEIDEEDYLLLLLKGLMPPKNAESLELYEFVKKMNKFASEGLT